jgi:protoporphyrinogen oxidase
MRAPESHHDDPSTPPVPRTRTAIIIGAGPAGLTAAYELLKRTDIKPIVLERSNYMGGISRTVNFKGNRIDIGGHRFFSKSDRVMNWWLSRMPLRQNGQGSQQIKYHGMTRDVASPTPSAPTDTDTSDRVMLIRKRKSRIYFLRKFFDYPISLTVDTLRKLGLFVTVRAGFSYLRSLLFPIKDVTNLEQFFINRFGRVLYRMFFKSYTEKVWGVPCDRISAEWGAQRIKGLSLRTALAHFLKRTFSRKKSSGIAQKGTETSLIERFLYPKFGPGQLWEHVAGLVAQKGGEVRLGWRVTSLNVEGDRIASVQATDPYGASHTFPADYVFSTMPVRELIHALRTPVPDDVLAVADGLLYRDFITVGLLVDRLSVTESDGSTLKDTWIYIQEPDVLVGRLQIFNNWSPFMVADPSKVWIGLEYFCYESDALWKMSDEEMARFAIAEVEKIGILCASDVRDTHVVRVPKTYPAYFGTYDRFDEVVRYTDRFENLFLVGRNGMHKYNNQDHSMLTAMTAVDQIVAGRIDKSALWEINTEQEYHEEKK